MSGDSTSKNIIPKNNMPKNKVHRILKLAILLACLVLLALIVISIILGYGTCASRLTGLFRTSAPVISVEEFNFDVGRDRVFAYMEGSVAAIGTLGIQVYSADGRETLRDSFRMIKPSVVASGNRSIAFDIGGTDVRVFESNDVTTTIEASGNVVSASINQNGWFCVVTQVGGGIRGSVTVYNRAGLDVYKVNLGSGYVLSAQLSPDNRSLSVLNLTDYSSRVSIYHGLDEIKDEPDAIFDLLDGLIINIAYISNAEILAISTDSVLLIDSEGNGEMLMSFSDKRLGGFAHNDNFIALHLYDHGVGHRGSLVFLHTNGTFIGELTIDREIFSMSYTGNTLIALKSDGLAFISYDNEELSMYVDSISAAGASRVLAVNEFMAIAASDHSAVVVTRNPE